MTRIAREFARNAEGTEGRSMIVMGAGTNHWFHSDQIYRAMLSCVLLCGCQGVNGGGWAHYVGQEKVRPITGFGVAAFALDWTRPPRQQATTSVLVPGDRPVALRALRRRRVHEPARRRARWRASTSPTATRRPRAWAGCRATRRFNRNPLDLGDEADAAGKEPAEYVVDELKAGRLRFACEDPDDPANFPRVLTLWRANLLGSSSKGHEYFLQHLLGVDQHARPRDRDAARASGPKEVEWRDEAPNGKLDLFTTIDFRMNGSALYSDVVLPAATWYEKHDISSTDLHPFVHPFNEAIPPPWEARTDWDIFNRSPSGSSELAKKHLGVRTDIVAAPLLHDTPEELAQPGGVVRDWKDGECEPIPGKTMPKLIVVERDYGAVAEKMTALGPLVEKLGIAWKGVSWKPAPGGRGAAAAATASVRGGVADGRPQLRTANARRRDDPRAVGDDERAARGRGLPAARAADRHASSPTSPRTARTTGSRSSRCGIQPRKVIASPEWSGIESRDRRYSPFTVNVERDVPWRTLTGRQHFYVDHDWMLEFGEGLPAYRPPLATARHAQGDLDPGAAEVVVRWISPHSKWSIHSEFQDNLRMLSCSAAGRSCGSRPATPRRSASRDNDWVEVFNRNGVVACRAVVSHRIPDGRAFMYHSQDRHVNVPISETSGHRGGTDNSLTRIIMKPTHLIGGYAQLSCGFNYYGPTGSQRDELTLIRKRKAEVDVLMRVRAQIGMVMNLDKCIGCHTCSVTCKNVWTNRKGAEYIWFNNVETKPGVGYPKRWEDQEQWKGGWELDRRGKLRLKAGGPLRKLATHLRQPGPARARRLLRAVDLRLRAR